MPEPLIRSEHVVGSWDPDAGGWTARDFTPGPAGSVGVELPGGVEVDIDVAAPSTLVGLWAPSIAGRGIPEAAPDTMRTLVALLGDHRAAELLGMLKGGGPPRLLRSGPSRFDRPNRREPRTFRGSERDGVEPAIARMALALAVTDNPGQSPLAHALASLDAAIAARQLDDGLATDSRRRAAGAADLLLAAVREGELDGQPVDEDQLVDALHDLVLLLDSPAQRAIQSLADEVASGAYDLPGGELRLASMLDADIEPMRHPSAGTTAPGLAYAPPPRRPAGAVLDAIDTRALPDRFARDQIAARITTDSEIEVRIHGRAADAEGWWARAFSTGDVVVAAAPLRASGRDAVARLLVPPAMLRSVAIDITNTPGQPRTPQSLRSVADAVAMGQAAARSERLRDRGQARQRWTAAAEAWSTAGDPARAGLAAEYARGPRGRRDMHRVPEALLADAVVDADA